MHCDFSLILEFELPSDGNLSCLDENEMILFLEDHGVDKLALKKWHQNAISGAMFGNMSDQQLEGYGANTATIRYFRNKTKTGPLIIL